MTLTANSNALVLFSGGQDSTVCLAWALERYGRVETVGFKYRQRHDVELECRLAVRVELTAKFPDWADRLGADHVIELDELGRLSETALTSEAEIVIAENGLPSTFVPGRNLLFFTYAAALGYRRRILRLVGGMCETDFSGYPDCRDATLQALAQAIRLGMEDEFEIETPLMWLTKAQTWRLAHDLGGQTLIDLIVEATHSCYRGERDVRHAWGYGCNDCPACQLRAKGFAEWQATADTPAAAR
jgi:7-cyano-7-deazaguanine synthase